MSHSLPDQKFGFKSRRFRGTVLPGAAALVALLANLPLFGRGFDFHHNGLMLAAAVAVSDGVEMHVGVFSQYGPFTTLTQSALIRMGGDPALALDVWSISLIVATAVLISVLGNILPRSWKLTPGASFMASLLWVSLSPHFQMGTIQAWSSLLAAFAVVLLVVLAAVATRFSDLGLTRASRTLWFISGLIVGVLPFVRLNVGVALWIGLLGWGGFVLAQRNRRAVDFLLLFAGWVGTTALTIIWLFTSGAFNAYVLQAIEGPLLLARSQADWGYFVRQLHEDLIRFAPRAIPLLMLGLALLIAVKFATARLLRISGLAGATVSLLAATFYAAGGPLFIDAYRLSGSFDGAAIPEATAFLSMFFLFAVLIVMMAAGALHLGSKNPLSQPNRYILPFFVVVVAGASFAQFWPIGDIGHLWWGAPLLTVLLALGISQLSGGRSGFVWVPSLIFIGSLQLINLAGTVEAKTELGPKGSVLERVLMEPSSSAYAAGVFELYQRHLWDEKMVLFFLHGGVEAVIGGSFQSADPVYASWAMRPESLDALDEWRGRSTIDYLSLQRFGLSDFDELAERYRLVAVGCSNVAEPYYNPGWDERSPYICVFEPRRNG